MLCDPGELSGGTREGASAEKGHLPGSSLREAPAVTVPGAERAVSVVSGPSGGVTALPLAQLGDVSREGVRLGEVTYGGAGPGVLAGEFE